MVRLCEASGSQGLHFVFRVFYFVSWYFRVFHLQGLHLLEGGILAASPAPEPVVECAFIAPLVRVQQAHDAPQLAQIVLHWRACTLVLLIRTRSGIVIKVSYP